MIDHLKAFLKYLALNRNLSRHTVRAYDSDLAQFLEHTAVGAGVKARDLAPSALDRAALRSFLAAMHATGHSRATAARKLAAVRTFLRYLRREALSITIQGRSLARQSGMFGYPPICRKRK
jgi:integrase/recombinase XerC